mgnify:CR=1 FL=1
MTWIQTKASFTYPLFPSAVEFNIEDIAHSLSNMCRYNGHTKYFYSVAEHSLLVASILPDKLKLEGLLHDAPEIYFTDLPAPIKGHFYVDILDRGEKISIEEFENLLWKKISKRWNLNSELSAEVKQADVNVALAEKHELFDMNLRWRLEEIAEPAPVKIQGLLPNQAKEKFLDIYQKLIEEGWHG